MEAARTRRRRGATVLLCAVLSVPAAADYEAGLDASDVGDYSTAFDEFARAAADGDLRAANSLGELYERGDGVERDAERAAEWYRRAAEAGNREAQYNLAGMYRSGDGVPLDPALSMQWYRRAADQRLAIAQFFVGKNYEHGQGVEQDPAEAWAWYSLAAVSGDSGSAGNRDRVARFLSEEQRQRAVILLRDHALDLALPPATLRALGVTPPAGGTSAVAVAGDTAAQDMVGAIQQALADLGYDIGEIDGLAGPRTRRAISAFARSVGMEGDPRIDPLLLEQLHAARDARRVAAQELEAADAAAPAATDEVEQEVSGSEPPPEQTAAPLVAVAAMPAREALRERLQALGYGALYSEPAEREALAAFSRDAGLDADALSTEAMLVRMDTLLPAVASAPQGNELVRAVQVELAALGHDPGPRDGLMGSRTRAALAAFASDAGFPQSPGVSPVLLARLRVQTDSTAAAAWSATDPLPAALPDTTSASTIAATQPETANTPLVESPSAFEEPPPRGAALVHWVQSRLDELGYEPGPVDGLLGSRTRRAAREFRADRDLPGDTQVDELLYRQLDAVRRASAPPAAVQAALVPPVPALITDTPGALETAPVAATASANPPVREAQRLLAELGFDVGDADGVVGARTRNAVRAFEQAHGHDGDGRIDAALVARLRAAVQGNALLATGDLREARRGLLLRGYRPAAATGPMDSQTRTAIATFQRDQGLGVTGELDQPTLALLRTSPSPPEVSVALLRDVQSVLVERGYDPGPIDGAMGPSTRAALAVFRRDEGLPGDAVLDIGTLRRLGLAPGG